jgi:hypothetical protein
MRGHAKALQFVAGRKGREMNLHYTFMFAAIAAGSSLFIRRFIRSRASARAGARLDACLAARQRAVRSTDSQ